MALSVKKIETVLNAQAGNVTKAAEALGISRQGLQKRIKGSAILQQAVCQPGECPSMPWGGRT